MYTAILFVSCRLRCGIWGLSRLRQPSEKLHNDEVITRVDLEFLGWKLAGRNV
jgi:hypothetical protein